MRTRMAPLVGWWVLGLVVAILVGGPPSGAAGWRQVRSPLIRRLGGTKYATEQLLERRRQALDKLRQEKLEPAKRASTQ
jgi:hypothetical protein